MRLSDLRAGVRMRLGLGTILVLTVVLGAVAWLEMDGMWQSTKGLYEHPLIVRRAIGDLRAATLAVDAEMSRAILGGSPSALPELIQKVAMHDAAADRLLSTIYGAYLGPRTDVDALSDAIAGWRAGREETVRLFGAEAIAEAADRVGSTGVDGLHVADVMATIMVISDYALAKGEEFYQAAQQKRVALRTQLLAILAAVVAVSLGAGYFLLRGVRRPLRELTDATERFQGGDLGARSRYASADEFGVLSASFNNLAQTVQAAAENRQNAARLAQVMLMEEELHSFSRELLKVLLQDTRSQVGALYLLNEAGTDFEHFDSIGLADRGARSFSAMGMEGEFGAALATQQIQLLTDIPDDTRFTFCTVGGDFVPREIVTIPIVSGHQVVAMISLASVQTYSMSAMELLNTTYSVVTARLNGVLAHGRLRVLSETLEHQNQELEAQKRELAAQASEVGEQNAELEIQKRQLDEANRLKSAFLSNMSHELRTPLNSVIALSGVLNRRLEGIIPEEEYGYLDVIERNGRHLLDLINDILDLSRIEAGREDINVSRFLVRDLVGEVVATVEPQAREKNIEMLNNVADELPSVRSDYAKCRHILQNIVGNAVKFTDRGGVALSAALADEQMHIVVTDTGIGIGPEDLSHIFDEFRQADDRSSRRFGGTGLGLAIAEKYAVLLGGAISVQSTLGTGSSFTFRLPLSIDMAADGDEAAQLGEHVGVAPLADEPPLAAIQGEEILLVEDSEPAIIQMTDILAHQGYRVQVARNGREALDLIETAVPDAMILDLMMPEVDGFEVLRTIRGTEKTARVPVLILTAKHVTKEELAVLKGNNIHQLIQKGGISRTELLKAVKSMVSSRRESPLPTAQTPVRTRSSDKLLILVVEDNQDNMRTVKALLGDGYTILEATDGRTAVEQAKEHWPDLVLTDLALPVMDGFRVLDEIRGDKFLRSIPVVAVTASAMKGNREDILAYGFDGYISKPIDGELLEQTIREILHGV